MSAQQKFPVSFLWAAAIAASLFSFSGSASYLGRQMEAAAVGAESAAASGRIFSLADIAPLAPGSISAITPLPAPAAMPAPPASALEASVAPETARPLMTVAIDALNVRDAPSNRGRRIGVVRGGQEVAIMGEDSGWMRIEAPGISGWVYRGHLRPAD